MAEIEAVSFVGSVTSEEYVAEVAGNPNSVNHRVKISFTGSNSVFPTISLDFNASRSSDITDVLSRDSDDQFKISIEKV